MWMEIISPNSEVIFFVCYSLHSCVDHQSKSDNRETYMKVWALDLRTMRWSLVFGRDGLSACMQGMLNAAKTEEKRAHQISEAERSKGFSLGTYMSFLYATCWWCFHICLLFFSIYISYFRSEARYDGWVPEGQSQSRYRQVRSVTHTVGG